MTGSEVASPRVGGATAAEGRREMLGELLGRIRDGDRDAIGELVRLLSPLLWTVARSQGLDRDLAGDAVQNTWLQLLRSTNDIRVPQALTGWLVTVVRREATRLAVPQMRQRPTDPDLLFDVADPDPEPDELASTNEQYQRMWWWVRQLSPKCRALLRVVALVDRPDYAAVSEALGMPKGSIGPTRGRCLTKLRQLLEADPTWSGP